MEFADGSIGFNSRCRSRDGVWVPHIGDDDQVTRKQAKRTGGVAAAARSRLLKDVYEVGGLCTGGRSRGQGDA